MNSGAASPRSQHLKKGIKIYPKGFVAWKGRPAEIALWCALRGAGLPMASWIDSEINGDDHELTPERSSRPRLF